MRLKTLQIKNYRAFRDETVRFNDYTVLVGPNGVGKSTVLSALNVLFREKENAATDTTMLEEQDFYGGNIDEPIEIIATFHQLTDAAKEDLSDYVRQEQLIVAAVATYDRGSRRAEVKQYGERLGLAPFAGFFKAQNDGEKVATLREVYKGIREIYPDLPASSTGPAMTEALRDYEKAHPEQCVPLRSSDNFYGARKGRLDRYVQWIYVPAVKDAKAEQVESKNTALGRLLSRTVRAKTNFDDQVEEVRRAALQSYSDLLSQNQAALADISGSLSARLQEWAHPDATLRVVWNQDADRAVRVEPPMAKALAGEAGFEGDVARLGHGLQRSFILAVLHELSQVEDESVPTLLLGVEEPELYQHPPQARHLASVLLKIASGNSQVLVTTHSPYYTSGQNFENVRMFRRGGDRSVVQTSATFDAVAEIVAGVTGKAQIRPAGVRAKVHQAMMWSLAEMFFVNKVVFVEGPEDIAYLSQYLHAVDKLDELRAKGVGIVPTSSKSGMVQAVAIAKCLQIPHFAVWDSDGHEQHVDRRAKHEADNIALRKLFGCADLTAFPDVDVFDTGFCTWRDEASARFEADCDAHWVEIKNAASEACGHTSGIGKHSLFISELLVAALERDVDLQGLRGVSEKITEFASR